MCELKKIGKIFMSKFVGTGSSSYKKRIYRAAVSQRFRNTALKRPYGLLGLPASYSIGTGFFSPPRDIVAGVRI